jgi:hypothetical protein
MTTPSMPKLRIDEAKFPPAICLVMRYEINEVKGVVMKYDKKGN